MLTSWPDYELLKTNVNGGQVALWEMCVVPTGSYAKPACVYRLLTTILTRFAASDVPPLHRSQYWACNLQPQSIACQRTEQC